jgi:hypothetical protein
MRGEGRAFRRHIGRHGDHGAGWQGHAGLMGMQAEDTLPHELRRPTLDPRHHGIAIFDREGKIALLKGTAHAGPFAFGHLARENQRFGAAADAADQRTKANLIRPGRRRRALPNLGTPGAHRPER